ncbi:Glia maturation factor beta [Eumeta japonica]|uniref:Glia maturation factor beta n=1 Tax=Eumeta variegata TaxID=151549 RepID=A0A4C1ZTQ3_EUMVA|nr:Glia maturation factor beta [Eumeta japonica]
MSAQCVNVCDIGDEVSEALKKFKFQKHTTNCALIIKVNRDKQVLEVEDELENVELEDLQEILPSHQPRFILYNYKMHHSDGRVSFPLRLIFYTPRDAPTALQVQNTQSIKFLKVMYAGTQRALAAAAGAPRPLDVRELPDLTTEWLRARLQL